MATNDKKVNLRVIVRCKPDENEEVNGSEEKKETKFDLENNRIEIYGSRGGRKPLEFEFDKILLPSTTQESTFDTVAKSVISDVLQGYNSSILCYGETNSGKTHTLLGKEGSSDPTMMGLLPRCVAYCIHCIKESRDVVEASITISAIEIYQEQLKDLISPQTSSKLKIKISPSGETYVENLTQQFMQSSNDALKMIEIIKLSRTKISKSSKFSSSRSNCLACLTVKQKMSNSTQRKAKCYFGDLASSDITKNNDNNDDNNHNNHNNDYDINNLRLVIHSLSAKKSIIPYNNSSLTTILKDSFGGNTKTTIIVTCSMHHFHRDETINSLRFGQRARLITNSIKLNRDLSRNEMKRIIDKQELQIQALQSQLNNDDNNDNNQSIEINKQLKQSKESNELKELKELRLKYDKLQQEYSRERAKNMEQTNKYQDLESNYDDIKRKYQHLENQNNLLNQNNQRQNDEIQSLKQQITNYIAKNDNLNYKINDLSQKNTELQAISNTILS